MKPNESEVQGSITTFWNTVAPLYDHDPGNVPNAATAEYRAWVQAVARLLPPAPSDVLDIGTGTGFVALIASNLGHRVTGVDLSTSMLAEARSQAKSRGSSAQFLEGDAVTPPVAERSADSIICRHLLWTLRSPDVALAKGLQERGFSAPRIR